MNAVLTKQNMEESLFWVDSQVSVAISYMECGEEASRFQCKKYQWQLTEDGDSNPLPDAI